MFLLLKIPRQWQLVHLVEVRLCTVKALGSKKGEGLGCRFYYE
jgi:hypothetical protein